MHDYSGVESAHLTAYFDCNLARISVWVWVFR